MKKGSFYLALALCLVFLVASGYLYMQWDNTKKELVSAQQEAESIRSMLAQKERNMVDLQDEISRKQNFEERQKKNIDSLSQSLERANMRISELETLLQENKSAVEEVEAIKLKLTTAITDKEELERELARHKKEMGQEIEQLKEQKLELEQKLQEVTGEIPGAVKIENVKILTGKKFAGKVLVVNKKYNFIIVNIGKDDGIEDGTVLIVHRGKKFIGKAAVKRTYKNMSAADLIDDWKQDEVNKGDGVKKF